MVKLILYPCHAHNIPDQKRLQDDPVRQNILDWRNDGSVHRLLCHQRHRDPLLALVQSDLARKGSCKGESVTTSMASKIFVLKVEPAGDPDQSAPDLNDRVNNLEVIIKTLNLPSFQNLFRSRMN